MSRPAGNINSHWTSERSRQAGYSIFDIDQSTLGTAPEMVVRWTTVSNAVSQTDQSYPF